MGPPRWGARGPVSAPSVRRLSELRAGGEPRGVDSLLCLHPLPPRRGRRTERAPALRPQGPCIRRSVSQSIPALLCLKERWEIRRKAEMLLDHRNPLHEGNAAWPSERRWMSSQGVGSVSSSFSSPRPLGKLPFSYLFTCKLRILKSLWGCRRRNVILLYSPLK